jgi:Fe-S cluster assembly protein SufD
LLVEDPDWLRTRLASSGGQDDLALLALNSAFMSDGFVIHLAPGTMIEAPIELVFRAAAGSDGVHYHPRNLIIAEAGSRADIIERHVGAQGSSFANNASEAVLGADARIRHYKLQDEDPAAIHVSTTLATVAGGGAYESFVMSTGAKLSRNEIRVRLEGEGAETRLDGIYLARGAQHMDHTTLIEHAAPGAASSETYKGALDDQARAVFQGNILVAPDAQKTDGRMNNATLLLSGGAEIDAKPQLEIYADDVKCSHGATAGELDDDALFYLRSRGIEQSRARAMLIEAFLGEVVDTVARGEAREIFGAALADWLVGGAREMRQK